MADLKELLSSTKELSLLYIDENQKFLTTVTTLLKQVFLRVDDASDATLGLGYLKVHEYDIVIVDSSSQIMDAKNLIKNIRLNSEFQEIIITTPSKLNDEVLNLYKLNVSSVHQKPFEMALLFDSILNVSKKLKYNRDYLQSTVAKLNEDITSQKRRIGRFMMSEKNLKKQIENFKSTTQTNKHIYDLTKLPSRYALQDSLDGREQSIVYINIDHFDFVNTTYGMGKANKLLKECGSKLGLFLPTNATLYHITADEFVILLDEPSENQAYLLASQIQSLFKESRLEFDGHSHYVVFSIGIDHGAGKKLFINSKAASKEARYFGGNQIVLFNIHSQYMKEQRESLYWVGILQKAFDEDKIFTYYQPICSNKDSEVKHYEVLCRLMDDNNKLVDANKFIQSAKHVGLITQITKTVIDKTFKLFKNNDYNFSINISMHDLHEEYLFQFLNYKCNRYSVMPSRVHLEIVEDIIINKFDVFDKQIQDLKSAGYHVIVDDFGTDKSAYSRMFELRADYIKIDGAFIKELKKDKAHQVIVKSIVDFAKKSGIKTIAEHVESQEVYDIVNELEIDYSQGYYVGKPSLNLE
ncbi:MAG: EAL domain-containing protein [Campylobacterota bacterium]|nr:EAL domain-containing protein [Campylobacterota bacterium]